MTFIRVKAQTAGGTKVDWGAGHRDNNGYLICRQIKRGRWFNYIFGGWDDKRCSFCEAHRHNKVPETFRNGKLFSITSILFTLGLILKGEWRGL